MLVAQLCLTLCDPMVCSPPGSSVHGILQARILEWVAIPFSRGSSQSRNWTQVSHMAEWFFTIWATREAHNNENFSDFRIQYQSQLCFLYKKTLCTIILKSSFHESIKSQVIDSMAVHIGKTSNSKQTLLVCSQNISSESRATLSEYPMYV